MYRGILRGFTLALVAATVACAPAVGAETAPATPPLKSQLTDPLRALSAEEQQRLCTRAQALAKADLIPAAKVLHEQLLGRAACAKEVARAIKAAEAAATSAAKKPAAKTKAAKDTQDKFDKAIAEVSALQREGFDAEARKKLQEVVLAYPTRNVPNGLREPDQQLSGWRTFLGDVGPVVATVLEIAAALLAALLAIVLLIYGTTRLIARGKLSVELVSFAGDDKEGSLTTSVQDRLMRLASSRQSDAILRATPGDGDFKLPDPVAKTVPQATLIEGLLSMLDRLLPREVRRIKGTVLPEDPQRGAGVAITVSDRRGAALERLTLFEADYGLLPKAGSDGKRGDLAWRRTRLAIPVATWLAYLPELGSDAAKPKLGTTDWRSYAAFAVGELALREGDVATARKMYMRALDIDPDNLGATLNLASLRLHDPPNSSTLPSVDEQLGAVRDATDHMSSLWYRATYLLAVTHLYAKGTDDPAKAAALLDGLQEEIEAHRDDADLRPLLAALELPARVARASATALMGGQPNISFLPPWRSGETQYNLACMYARWSSRGNANEAAERKKEAIELLLAAIERLGPSAKAWAAGDPALEPLHDMPGWP